MSNRDSLTKNKEIVKKYLIALGEMRADDASQLMQDGCICEVPNITMPQQKFSKSEFIGFVTGLKAAIPNGIRFEFIEMTAEDNRVSTIVNGYSETIEGTEYNNRYHFLHYLEDGKITKHLEYIDSFYASKVMGPILKKLYSA